MAITLKELIEDRTKLASLGGNQRHCCRCGVLLQETVTGRRKTPGGEACSDCYYEELGEIVEQHPVVSGRVRRG